MAKLVASSSSEAPDSAEGIVIWSLHIDELGAHDEDPRWKTLLSLPCLRGEDRTNITKFLFFDDQRRAMGSLLLQYALIRATFGGTDSHKAVRRTPEVRCTYVACVCCICNEVCLDRYVEQALRG
jgi:hypothetical protein